MWRPPWVIPSISPDALESPCFGATFLVPVGFALELVPIALHHLEEVTPWMEQCVVLMFS